MLWKDSVHVSCLLILLLTSSLIIDEPKANERQTRNNNKSILHMQKIWVVDGQVSMESPAASVQGESAVYFDQRPLLQTLATDASSQGGMLMRAQNHFGNGHGDALKSISTIKIKDLLTKGAEQGVGLPDSLENNLEQRPASLQKPNQSLYLPDLVVHSYEVAPHPIPEGGQVTVIDCVLNNGWGVAGYSAIDLYLSLDGDTNLGNDCYVGQQAVSALGAGGWEYHSWTFTFPDLGSGTYALWLAFVVDCNNQVAESDEANLFFSDQLTVQDVTGAPDLRALKFLWTPEPATEGQAIAVSAQIYNDGNANATAGAAVLYLATDAQFMNSVSMGELYYAALAPGGSVWLEWDFSFPDLGSGTYPIYLAVSVDYYNQCAESDENNFFPCNNTITVNSGQMLPDLQGPYFWYSYNYVTEGNHFWVASCVYNAGSVASAVSHVRAFLSVDGDYDTSDDYALGKQAVPPVYPDYYQTVRWDFTFPDLGEGTYPVYIITEVDCDNQVNESDETNNLWLSVGYFYAQDKIISKPDIAVDSLQFLLTQPEEDESIALSLGKHSPAQPMALGYDPGPARFEYTGITRSMGDLRDEDIPPQFLINQCLSAPGKSADLQKINMPNSLDWSQYDSPVKNQDDCEGCWAFATIGLLENLYNQKGESSYSIDLSEQVLVACTPTVGVISNDCTGGLSICGMEFAKTEGVLPESCFPFQNQTGNCGDKCSYPEFVLKVGKFAGWDWTTNTVRTVNDLKALLQKGPVKVSLICPPSFGSYRSGIYSYSGGAHNGGGHAVLCVGYNDTYGYFKIKNSWGNWGEQGYGYMAYSTVYNDYVLFGQRPIYTTPDDVFVLDYRAGRRTLLVSNEGTETLEISRITWDQPWLFVSDQFAGELEPEQKTGIAMGIKNWADITPANKTATVTIYSNDPDESALSIVVQASLNPRSTGLILAENFDTWSGEYFPPVDSDWLNSTSNEASTWRLGNLQGYDFKQIDATNTQSIIMQGHIEGDDQYDMLFGKDTSLPDVACTLEFWVCVPSAWIGLWEHTGEIYVSMLTNGSFDQLWYYDFCSGEIEGWQRVKIDLSPYKGMNDICFVIEFYGKSGPGIALDRFRIYETGSALSVDNPTALQPSEYTLQAYPNPFNSSTQICFYLPERRQVYLAVYDIRGRLVEKIVHRHYDAGMHKVAWNGMGYPSGVYLLVLKAGKRVLTRKCTLLK